MNYKYTFVEIAGELGRELDYDIKTGDTTCADGNGITQKEWKLAERRMRGRGIAPQDILFETYLQGRSSPWGKIQTAHKIVDGIYSVTTAGHGGLWLSDEKKKKLPKSYKPYTGNRRWAEEDEDGTIVLQHLGLLSLVQERLEIFVTQDDIVKGRESRKRHSYSMIGGPIAEAFNRQTDQDLLLIVYGQLGYSNLINGSMAVFPGGYRYCKLPEVASRFMIDFDTGQSVRPFRFFIEPYIYVPFNER